MKVLNNICSSELITLMDSYVAEIYKSTSPILSVSRVRANISDAAICMLCANTIDIVNKNAVLLFKNFCYLLVHAGIHDLTELDEHLSKAAKALKIGSNISPARIFSMIFKAMEADDLEAITSYFLAIHTRFCYKCEENKLSSIKIYMYTMALFLYIYSWFILYPTIATNWSLYAPETM